MRYGVAVTCRITSNDTHEQAVHLFPRCVYFPGAFISPVFCPQMAVDDLVAQHIDARLPPSRWRLTLPAAGSGGPFQHLTEEQLLEVRHPSPISRKSFSRPPKTAIPQDRLPPAVAGALRHLTQKQLLSVRKVEVAQFHCGISVCRGSSPIRCCRKACMLLDSASNGCPKRKRSLKQQRNDQGPASVVAGSGVATCPRSCWRAPRFVYSVYRWCGDGINVHQCTLPLQQYENINPKPQTLNMFKHAGHGGSGTGSGTGRADRRRKVVGRTQSVASLLLRMTGHGSCRKRSWKQRRLR